jgi:hypothetical protein
MFGAMPSRFIPRQKVGDSAPSRPLLTVGVGERLPVVIADDEAVRVVLNLPRSRKRRACEGRWSRHGCRDQAGLKRFESDQLQISCTTRWPLESRRRLGWTMC